VTVSGISALQATLQCKAQPTNQLSGDTSSNAVPPPPGMKIGCKGPVQMILPRIIIAKNLRLREQSADEVKATTSRSGLELQPLELPSPPVEHSTDHNPPGVECSGTSAYTSSAQMNPATVVNESQSRLADAAAVARSELSRRSVSQPDTNVEPDSPEYIINSDSGLTPGDIPPPSTSVNFETMFTRRIERGKIILVCNLCNISAVDKGIMLKHYNKNHSTKEETASGIDEEGSNGTSLEKRRADILNYVQDVPRVEPEIILDEPSSMRTNWSRGRILERKPRDRTADRYLVKKLDKKGMYCPFLRCRESTNLTDLTSFREHFGSFHFKNKCLDGQLGCRECISKKYFHPPIFNSTDLVKHVKKEHQENSKALDFKYCAVIPAKTYGIVYCTSCQPDQVAVTGGGGVYLENLASRVPSIAKHHVKAFHYNDVDFALGCQLCTEMFLYPVQVKMWEEHLIHCRNKNTLQTKPFFSQKVTINLLPSKGISKKRGSGGSSSVGRRDTNEQGERRHSGDGERRHFGDTRENIFEITDCLYSCHYCSKRIEPSRLKDHVKMYHREDTFRCGICISLNKDLQIFDLKSALDLHIVKQHPGSGDDKRIVYPGSLQRFGSLAFVVCRCCLWRGYGLNSAITHAEAHQSIKANKCLKGFKIFCRVCQESQEGSPDHDDEDDFKQHVLKHHKNIN